MADTLTGFRFHVRREHGSDIEVVEIAASSAADAVDQLPPCVSWNFAMWEDGYYRKKVNDVSTLSGARPIKLPVTLSEHGEPHVYVGRVFTYEGRSWTVTSGYGWPRAAARFWIAENPDGSGERRELTADELEAMLGD